jgi:hypothetical protein
LLVKAEALYFGEIGVAVFRGDIIGGKANDRLVLSIV